ncbi:MAG: hypothetical protein U5O16_39020 [Rhodococcus sp. (in: high G+C Gram-positive bacteria)]|uniref:hypothetical protein n=1 Tax=Rhodococcus sp. TaxID=1831 RepID=UPI002ADB0CA5|nr:hypothetical protein [Rhodococcus sp. (in: high G+C Gram-positive bacteria)]
MTQFDLLKWVADGCKEGVYEGPSHRVSARSLHNRGFLRVSGSGKTWAARITPDGARRLEEEALRIEAERARTLREKQDRLKREREQQQLREKAAALLRDVVAAGGRLDLGPDVDSQDVQRLQNCLASQSGLLPDGQRVAQEPTRMDPVLGVTVYLEPDFEVLTALRAFSVPRQLRNPHPAVAAFQEKKALVSKAQIARAARFLQALVTAATELGWTVPAKVPHRGRGESGPDLTLRFPSRELVVTIRELDQNSRRHVQAYTTETDYYTRAERTTANKHFQASGKLEVTLTKTWEDQVIASLRDTDAATVEEQLPTLVRKLEIAEAEAAWSRQEEVRRSEIHETRWEEVKQEAFTKLSYERNADRLRDELDRRQSAAAMRTYAEEVAERAEQLDDENGEEAREWATWIQEHAECIDPINGPLRLAHTTSCSHDELQPHMSGWSTHGPYRR